MALGQRFKRVISSTNDGGNWNLTSQAGIKNEMVALQ
jgi:hypothetical protein